MRKKVAKKIGLGATLGFEGDPKTPPFCAVMFSEQEKNHRKGFQRGVVYLKGGFLRGAAHADTPSGGETPTRSGFKLPAASYRSGSRKVRNSKENFTKFNFSANKKKQFEGFNRKV